MNKNNFNTLNIDRDMIENLASLGFNSMTEIQEKSLPYILDGEDVIAEVNEDNNTHVLHFAVGPDYIPANVTVDGMDASDPGDVWYVDIGEPVEIGVDARNAGFSGVSSSCFCPYLPPCWAQLYGE